MKTYLSTPRKYRRISSGVLPLVSGTARKTKKTEPTVREANRK